MEKKPQRLDIEGTADTCPQCGYNSGFHVSFAVTDEGTSVILVCPNCAARFDTGWKLQGK